MSPFIFMLYNFKILYVEEAQIGFLKYVGVNAPHQLMQYENPQWDTKVYHGVLWMWIWWSKPDM